MAGRVVVGMTEEKWKTLDTEYLLRSRYMTLRRDMVCLPDGRVNPEYYVLEFPEWVNVIALTREDRMVMVRQYRHGLGEYQTELVAGYVDPDDGSLLAAAQRELREETGYGGGRWEAFEILSANPANHSNLTHTFIARDVEYVGAQSLDDTEDVRCMLMSREEVMGLLRRGEIRQALMAAVLWRFFYENRLS
ncbi:MAG: NUDIX hydrolase [Bacteroidaceae bacterium]|nr:NUDIX hydrolase [Bacteroidaceae bacterium]